MSDDPIAFNEYEQMAECYAARIDTKAHNAFYDRPANISLLPPVNGKRVLDAGCGPGAYSEWLVNNGADVVGVDASPKMIELAQKRLGSSAHLVEANLEKPLSFLDSSSFDIIISGLVLDYIQDWSVVLAEFFRLLREPGFLIFSVSHPADEFFEHHPNGNYFETERVEMKWMMTGAPIMVPYYRRPLSAMIDSLLGAGFILEKLLEPRPVLEFKEQDPRDYEKLMRAPGFICFRARKGRT